MPLSPPTLSVPPSPPPAVGSDNEHLDLMSTFHYVVGGLGLVCGSFPLFHVAMGLFIALGTKPIPSQHGDVPPAWIGILFAVFGAIAVLMAWTVAICTLISGRFIKQRKKRTFSLVVAGIQCVFFPFGTVLGVFTLVVLMRPSVKQMYA